MKRHTLHMAAALGLLSLASCATQDQASRSKSDREPKIVLLYVSDLHSQLIPDSDNRGGYARLAALVNEERTRAGDATDVLLVLGGDQFGKGRLPCRNSNEMLCAPVLGQLKPDVVTFGNGELKFRASDLESLATQVGGVWVGSNVDYAKKSKSKFWRDRYAYTGPKSGLKIEFVSSATLPGPGEAKSGSQLDFVETQPDFSNLNPGTLVLLHDDLKKLEELRGPLCAAPNPPLYVLKAHEHRVDQGRRGCLTYTEVGHAGKLVAKLTLAMRREGLAVKSHQTIEVDEKITEDTALSQSIAKLYEKYGRGAHRRVVATPTEVNPERVGRFLALAYQRTSKADVALINLGAVKEKLPAGDVDWETVLNAVPYNNQLMGLDWPVSDLEKSLCEASRRTRDSKLDNGSELVLAGAELRDAGTERCRLVVSGGKKNPKVVIDSYMVSRSSRWLGKELSGKVFSYGLDTERALELALERYGKQSL